MDYLKLTVWASVDEIQEVLERGVLDRYGWSCDPVNSDQEWATKAGAGRALWVYDSGSVSVIEYSDEVTRGATFCSVEVKGAGCDHLGNEGVQLLFKDLQAMYRCRASRVDVMAHTELFGPGVIRDAVKAGDICSRSVSAEKLVYISSHAGDTCYLGMESKPAGGLRRSGDRALRVYDRRGATRVELQIGGEYARGAGDCLADSPLEKWPSRIRGMFRHYCDFVDRGADARATRCPPLSWWDGFVQGAEKISVRPTQLELEGTQIGRVDGILQRFSCRLYASIEAYGSDWVVKRIERHGKLRDSADHAELVRELKRYIGSGLAGVPDSPDDVPF